jgi:hypothetical protein
MSEINPLLSKIHLPGRRFRLPSMGLFYNNGEIDESVVDGEIQVFSMTAIDEISMRSPEYLFTGEAITRVFNRCIPEIKKPMELLSIDVDFLLTALRIVSYGDVIRIALRCPKCEEKQQERNSAKLDTFMVEIEEKAKEQEIDFDLAWNSPEVVEKAERIMSKLSTSHNHTINLNNILTNQTKEVTPDDMETYTVTLSNGQVLKMSPLRFSNGVIALQTQDSEINTNLDAAEDYVSFVISACIDSIDGHSIKADIVDWAKKLPISLKDEISNHMEKQGSFGTKFDYNIVCPDCELKREGDAMLNPITFFTIPSESTGRKS